MSFVSRWKSGESAVGQWLAGTATGSIVKTALVPVVIWVGDNVANWDIPPVVTVALIALTPALINAINGADTRYGVGSSQ